MKKIIKKGQQEIMGLAIVIILIILGILAIARLGPSQEFSYKKDYEHSKLASSMLDTLLRTTGMDCNGVSMAQILRDCVDNPNSLGVCNAQDSCAYFEQQSKEIFKNTLESWQINYEFSVFYDKESPIINLGKRCINKQSESFPVPTDSGLLLVKLDICR